MKNSSAGPKFYMFPGPKLKSLKDEKKFAQGTSVPNSMPFHALIISQRGKNFHALIFSQWAIISRDYDLKKIKPKLGKKRINQKSLIKGPKNIKIRGLILDFFLGHNLTNLASTPGY